MDSKKFLSLKKSQKNSFVKNFFENIDIKDEKIKESIIDWILRLNQRKISIDNFSFLFSKYTDIVFPIKLSGNPRNLLIEDNNGKYYYLWYNQYVDITEYSIGKRTNHLDFTFTYSLSKENEISLKEYEIVKIDENDTISNNHVKFCYNYKRTSTKVILGTKLEDTFVKLDFLYNSIDYLYDNQVAMEFFKLVSNSKHISNVFELLEYLLDNMKKTINPKTIFTISSSIKTDLSHNN